MGQVAFYNKTFWVLSSEFPSLCVCVSLGYL